MKFLRLLLLSALFATGAFAKARFIPWKAAGGGGGGGAWYNAGAAVTTGFNISTNTIWSNVTVSSSGSCTKLRLYIWTYYSTTTAKLALYSSLSPVSGATGTVSITGTGWFEATLGTPAAVTAGTYQVAVVVDSGAAQIGGGTDSGITSYLQSENLAAFPPTALVNNYATYSNQTWGVSMWVQ